MGSKKRRQSAFLAKHPWCCFCGGSKLATTRDHIPPRSVFLEKKWPEGYEFPACLACNNGSASDDVLVAFLSRLSPGHGYAITEQHEWQKLLDALREHYPGITKEMILSANDVRRWMSERGVEKPAGVAYGEFPMIKIPQVIVQAVNRFNQKLLRALHYRQTSKIVPANAWTKTKWWTNANVMAGEFPREIANIMLARAVLQRGTIEFSRQSPTASGLATTAHWAPISPNSVIRSRSQRWFASTRRRWPTSRMLA